VEHKDDWLKCCRTIEVEGTETEKTSKEEWYCRTVLKTIWKVCCISQRCTDAEELKEDQVQLSGWQRFTWKWTLSRLYVSRTSR